MKRMTHQKRPDALGQIYKDSASPTKKQRIAYLDSLLPKGLGPHQVFAARDVPRFEQWDEGGMMAAYQQYRIPPHYMELLAAVGNAGQNFPTLRLHPEEIDGLRSFVYGDALSPAELPKRPEAQWRKRGQIVMEALEAGDTDVLRKAAQVGWRWSRVRQRANGGK